MVSGCVKREWHENFTPSFSAMSFEQESGQVSKKKSFCYVVQIEVRGENKNKSGADGADD